MSAPTIQSISYPGFDPDVNRGPQLNAVAIAFLCLSAFTVALRAFSRLYTNIPFGTDDLLIAGAAVLSWVYTAICIVEVHDNFYGQHITKSNPYHLEQFGKELYALAIVYPIALTLSKLSLLALYWRIFRITTARRPLQIIAAINVAWMIAAFLVGIFSCTPIKANWNTMIPHHCVNYPSLFLSNEAITIALDLFVLLMPVYFISHLQRSLTQRISISITFLLGLIVTLVSALRLWRLILANHLPAIDVTFVETDAALWAIIELNVWVLVASIPTLRPLFNKALGERFKTARSGASHPRRTHTNASTYNSDSSGSGFAKSVRGLREKMGLNKGSAGGSRDQSGNRTYGTLQHEGSRTALHERGKGSVEAATEEEFGRYGVGKGSEMPPLGAPLGNGAHSQVAAERWPSSERDFEMGDLSGIRVQRDVEVGMEPHPAGVGAGTGEAVRTALY